MKLIKKLLIVAFLVSLLTPAETKSTKRLSCEITLLSDEDTNTSDYEKNSKDIIDPKSIHIIKAI